MRRPIALLLLAFTAATAHAGSFGGPTSLNTSTQTGAVGFYQGTARGNSLTGIIQFAYNSDGNPSSTVASTYVYFIDGTLVTGTLDASIQSSKITGILETGTVTSGSGNSFSPYYFDYEVPGGSFSANINTRSANYFFKGKGTLQLYTQATSTSPWLSNNRSFRVTGQRTSTTE